MLNKYVKYANVNLSNDFEESATVLQHLLSENKVAFPLTISWNNRNFKVDSRSKLILISALLTTAADIHEQEVSELAESMVLED